MKEEKSIFMDQFKEQEHLYLFNEDSLKRILHETGFPHIAIEPQIFPYDMFVFAGKTSLEKKDETLIVQELLKTAQGRTVLALLDLYNQLTAREKDRAARLEIINRLNAQLQICEKDRADRLDVINSLDAHLKICEKDRADGLAVINALMVQLNAYKKDRHT